MEFLLAMVAIVKYILYIYVFSYILTIRKERVYSAV